jgi:DHA2 family multidrug resistance protein
MGNPQAVQAIGGLQTLGMSHDQALASINNLVTQQAYMISTQEIFFGSSLIFLGLIVLVWLAIGRVSSAHDAGEAAAGAH